MIHIETYGSFQSNLELTEFLNLDIKSLDGALKWLDLGIGGIDTGRKMTIIVMKKNTDYDLRVIEFRDLFTRYAVENVLVQVRRRKV